MNSGLHGPSVQRRNPMKGFPMSRLFPRIPLRPSTKTYRVVHRIRFCNTFVVISCVVGFLGCGRSEDTIPKQLVAVKVARAERFDVSLTIRVPATLFPREQANLAARTAS